MKQVGELVNTLFHVIRTECYGVLLKTETCSPDRALWGGSESTQGSEQVPGQSVREIVRGRRAVEGLLLGPWPPGIMV